MKRFLAILAVTAVMSATAAEKLTPEQRIEILRGLTAEFATMKVPLPRSKKPLIVKTNGAWDKARWDAAGKEYGPAARVGDLVQITKLSIETDKLVMEINGGFKGGRKWYEGVQIGVGGTTRPISGNQTVSPGGTTLALQFEGPIPPLKAADIKRMLAPIMDFERRTATENYVDTLPEPIKAAIQERRAVEGMDRDQVILALGKPEHKVRETKDGVEFEDWIYGKPPGKITFVTFNGNKVVQVRDAYAGLGGSVAPPLPPR
jgi:hypothetical protein